MTKYFNIKQTERCWQSLSTYDTEEIKLGQL